MPLCVALLVCLLGGCGEDRQALTSAGLVHLTEWFQLAADGERGDDHCHAFGLLEHPDVTCAEMLDHASRIVASERTVASTRFIECVEAVCGEFLEVELAGVDNAGRDVTEIAVLKRDDGRFRLYWYRTTSLIEALTPSTTDARPTDDDEDQKAYTRLTNEHRDFYQFPPCLDVRVSSSNMVGGLVRTNDIDIEDFETRSDNCPDTFCLAFVGRKVAGICP